MKTLLRAMSIATILGAHTAMANVATATAREAAQRMLRGAGKVSRASAKPTSLRTAPLRIPQTAPVALPGQTVSRLGGEAVKLEARAPGLARQAYSAFGKEGGQFVATHVPTSDIPRLLAYANRADSPATRAQLLAAYRKEGSNLFRRIPAKLILASGLSASMLLGTVRATQPATALADAIGDQPELAAQAIREVAVGGTLCGFAGLILLAAIIHYRLRASRAKTPTS